MSKRPSVYGVPLNDLETQYGAHDFKGTLSRYVVHCQHPGFSRRQVEDVAARLYIPFHKLSVYHRIKFVSQDPYSSDPYLDIVVDSIHCEPSCSDQHGNYIPGCFDVAVMNIENGGQVGVKGRCLCELSCPY